MPLLFSSIRAEKQSVDNISTEAIRTTLLVKVEKTNKKTSQIQLTTFMIITRLQIPIPKNIL